jgi:hypothetical protein
LKRPNGIAYADRAGSADLGENTLLIIEHALAQSLANGIHFLTRIAWRDKEQHSVANSNFPPNERHQINPVGLDIRTRSTWRNAIHAQGGGMFGELFAFDQSDLAL